MKAPGGPARSVTGLGRLSQLCQPVRPFRLPVSLCCSSWCFHSRQRPHPDQHSVLPGSDALTVVPSELLAGGLSSLKKAFLSTLVTFYNTVSIGKAG